MSVICFKYLTLVSDNEYGTHVIYYHGYDSKLNMSYYTEYEDISDILKELINKIDELKKSVEI